MTHTKLRIAFLGDSITVGDGDEAARGWPSRLMEATLPTRKMQCYNLGVGGDRIVDVANRCDAELAARLTGKESTGVVVMIGVNDALRAAATQGAIALDLETIEAHFAHVLQTAKIYGPVLVVEAAPVLPCLLREDGGTGARIMEILCAINLRLRSVAKIDNIPVLPLTKALRSDAGFTAGLIAGDGLHPSGAGYAKISDVIAQTPLWSDYLDNLGSD